MGGGIGGDFREVDKRRAFPRRLAGMNLARVNPAAKGGKMHADLHGGNAGGNPSRRPFRGAVGGVQHGENAGAVLRGKPVVGFQYGRNGRACCK